MAGELVTVENFIRAESDRYFATVVELAGAVGRFDHRREVMAIDRQTVIRANRDTLYSAGVFDLEAGPLSVRLPDSGGRFMSLLAITEDHYTAGVFYDAKEHTFDRELVGTRYLMLGIRTFVDPSDPDDPSRAHALQDAIETTQSHRGEWRVPAWDRDSQDRIRNALLVLGESVSDANRTFGPKNEVDPVRHLIGTATGWGGNPESDATYITVTPKRNDGTTIHRLTVSDVPVEGFWSITVYNREGYLEPNELGVYSINNVSATRDDDGSVSIQFGGCAAGSPNCIPVTPGWSYWVRLYRPRPEILNGNWSFPEATAID